MASEIKILQALDIDILDQAFHIKQIVRRYSEQPKRLNLNVVEDMQQVIDRAKKIIQDAEGLKIANL